LIKILSVDALRQKRNSLDKKQILLQKHQLPIATIEVDLIVENVTTVTKLLKATSALTRILENEGTSNCNAIVHFASDYSFGSKRAREENT
jgi:hypothetical protein